jgi:dTDP-glucose pyrophosphorylase
VVRKVLLYRYRITEINRYYITEADSVKKLAARGDRWKKVIEVEVVRKVERIAKVDR